MWMSDRNAGQVETETETEDEGKNLASHKTPYSHEKKLLIEESTTEQTIHNFFR